jgi:hypothetical protein
MHGDEAAGKARFHVKQAPRHDPRRPFGYEAATEHASPADCIVGVAGIGEGQYPQPVRSPVERSPVHRFHVKQLRWMSARPPLYPQGVTTFYVVFHVKLGCLWITSVDNYRIVTTAVSVTAADVSGTV